MNKSDKQSFNELKRIAKAYDRLNKFYAPQVRKEEREGLRVIKDAFNMFKKAERKLAVKKTVTRKPRVSTKKQQAQI